MNLSSDGKISQLATVTAGAAGTAAYNSLGLDMEGFERALFQVSTGPIVASGVQSIKLQQSDDDGGTDPYSDVAGTNQVIADTDDDKTFYIDIERPTKRWLRMAVSRATANSTFGAITAYQSGARKKPTVHGANVSGEKFVSPAEGTA